MTKITLYNGISLDGYIAKSDGNSNWVINTANFEKTILEKQVVIVGRKTFDKFYGEAFPIERILNIVVTTEVGMEIHDVNVKPVNSITNAMDYLSSHQIKEALLLGGGNVNASFLKENKIDEVWLEVYPIILGKGIKLFENLELEKTLNLIDVMHLENNILLVKYSVKND